MFKKLKQFIQDFSTPAPAEVHVITYPVGGRKLYFSNMKKKEVNFCSLAASAWWFGSEYDANEMRDNLALLEADYSKTNVETLTFKR